MEARRSIELTKKKRSSNLDQIFDSAKKDTVIRLRWPLVIFSSYLLYYTPVAWLTATQIQTILSLYLLSHATLYFVADEFFDSPYFYGPLLIFDTLILIVALSISGAASPEFYIACVVTLVLSCICNDARGLLIVTLLAPLVYGYFVFSSSTILRPNIYLQLPFPFVISLFYGYFAQVGRIRRQAREKEEQITTKEQKAAEELRRQRERLEVLHEVNLSAASTIDSGNLLELFLEKALIHLPYAAAIVRLRDALSRELETAATKGLKTKGRPESGSLLFIDQIVEDRTPLIVRNLFADARVGDLDFFKNEGHRDHQDRRQARWPHHRPPGDRSLERWGLCRCQPFPRPVGPGAGGRPLPHPCRLDRLVWLLYQPAARRRLSRGDELADRLGLRIAQDRKSTRLNSSHQLISY